ncbi:hypothetical protein GOV09_03465 [Candidatus Woesearchaeota archaeon]|nr:hypothetical protein [Candidatus Woesearchaeota archaeon]
MDIRKILIIFVVGLLFSVLVFSVIEAVYPQPDWDDFCEEKFPTPVRLADREKIECPDLEVPKSDQDSCKEKEGDITFNYDENGCATSFECSTCRHEYDQSRERYNQVVFYVSAILALLAIFIGLFLPAKANTMNEWIGTGFMLGGVFALFFGTIRSFGDLGRFVRPIVIFIELVLVIYISYRKVGNLRKDKKRK